MRVMTVFLITCLCLGFTSAAADSLWKKDSTSPYSTHKAFKVGDIITVIILESTSALQKAGTTTSVKDDLALQFYHTVYRPGPGPEQTEKGTASWSNIYAGTGQTERSSRVQAKIAATVVKVLPNGNLVISGSHRVEVHEELQEVKIRGVIRPRDVSLANAIYSYQVADADVSVKGTGTVAEAQAPGWITRILNWLF